MQHAAGSTGFPGRRAAEPRSPRPRAPGSAQREEDSRLRREEPENRVPPQWVPYLGEEPRSGEEPATEGRGPGRRRRRRHAGQPCPPPANQACLLLPESPGSAAKGKLETPGARRPLQPGSDFSRLPGPPLRRHPRTPRALPTVLGFVQTSSHAETFPKVRFRSHGPRAGDLLSVGERNRMRRFSPRRPRGSLGPPSCRSQHSLSPSPSVPPSLLQLSAL